MPSRNKATSEKSRLRFGMFRLLRNQNPMTKSQPIDTRQVFNGIWTIWKITGLHRPKATKKLYYIVYSLVMNFLSTFLVPLTMVLNITVERHKVLETLNLGIGNISLNLKFVNTMFVMKNLIEISTLLKDLDARIRGEEDRKALDFYVRRAMLIFKIFIMIHAMTWAVLILRVIALQERVLVFPAYYYVNWRDSTLVYALILVYQIAIAVVQCLQNCAVGTYPICYLYILTGHLKALEIRIRQVGFSPHEDPLGQLIQCIKDHQQILKLYKLIQKAISVNGFILFSTAAFFQCSAGFMFFYNDDNSLTGKATGMMTFTIITSEVLMICYVGNMMQNQAERLFQAFYFTKWHERSQSFKRILLIALHRTMHPCEALAGGYIQMNLMTFIRLMKTTYSVFTLLLNMDF